jgi:hypothetical protein
MLLQLEEPMGEAWKFSKTNYFSGIGKKRQNCAFMFCYLESVKYSLQIEAATDIINIGLRVKFVIFQADSSNLTSLKKCQHAIQLLPASSERQREIQRGGPGRHPLLLYCFTSGTLRGQF